MKEPPLPTGAELAILNVLWAKGPSTVRVVFAELESTTRDKARVSALPRDAQSNTTVVPTGTRS